MSILIWILVIFIIVCLVLLLRSEKTTQGFDEDPYLPPIRFLESGEKLDVPAVSETVGYDNLTMKNGNSKINYFKIPIPSLGSDYPGEVYVPQRYLDADSKASGWAFVSPYYKNTSYSTKCACNYSTCSCLNLPKTLFESGKDMSTYNLDKYEKNYVDTIRSQSADLIRQQKLMDNPGGLVTTQNDDEYYKAMVTAELALNN